MPSSSNRAFQKAQPSEALPAHLTRVLEAMTDGFIGLSDELVVTYFNAAAERILGRARQDVIGEYLFDAFPEGRGSVFETNYREAVRTRRSRAFEVEFEAPPYRNWYEVRVHPTEDGIAVFFSATTERKRAEAALREREDLYRTLFQTMAQGVVYQAADGTILSANHSAQEILGLSLDQLCGRTSLDPRWRAVRGDGSEFPGAEHPSMVALRTGKPVNDVLMGIFHPQEDEYRWILVSAKPEFLAGAERPFRVFATFTDITERKNAEEALRTSRATLAAALASMTDAVLISDVDGQFLNLSQACASFHRFSCLDEHPSTQRGLAAYIEMLAPDDTVVPISAWPLTRALGGETGANLEYSLRRRDTGERWVASFSFAPIREASGQLRGAVVVGRDISEHKRSEAERQRALQDVAEQRGRMSAVMEAERRKDEFLAMLSHELRNPLTAIRNSLYVLGRTAPGGSYAERATSVIDRQSEHLSRLVDDLLDVTRIARGKVVLQRELLSLGELVRRTAADFHDCFATAGVTLSVLLPSEQVWVLADRIRLAQVLGNLLHNATKFTPAGGATRISVGLDETRTQALLRVEDTGRGIPQEVLPRVFEAFTQIEPSIDRQKGGLGLGLALVKGVVDLHGGSVRAESRGLGFGSAFVVSLPLAEPSPSTKTPNCLDGTPMAGSVGLVARTSKRAGKLGEPRRDS